MEAPKARPTGEAAAAVRYGRVEARRAEEEDSAGLTLPEALPIIIPAYGYRAPPGGPS